MIGRYVWAMVWLTLLGTLSGCLMFGALGYKVMGPPAIPAKYEPAKVRTLVLVESYQNPSATIGETERLMRVILDDLNSHKVLPLVEPDELYRLRDAKMVEYRKMKIQEIGRAVGAEQVIYVNLLKSNIQMQTGGSFYKGELSGTVKVVDAQTGATLWPDNDAGYPVGAESPMQRLDSDTNPDHLRQWLTEQMGLQISRLFYKFKPDI